MKPSYYFTQIRIMLSQFTPPHYNILFTKIAPMFFLIIGVSPSVRAQSGCNCGIGGLDLSGSSSILLSELISDSQLPAGSSNIGCISVPANTTLTIDVDYTFSGTTFITAGDSRIVVEPAFRLTLQNNCVLQSCDGGGWGIHLQPGNASSNTSGGQLDMSNSTATGSSIVANHLSKIRLVSNLFHHGTTALIIRGYVSFIHLGDHNDFTGNSFSYFNNAIWMDHAVNFNIGNKNASSFSITNNIYHYYAYGSGITLDGCTNIGIFNVGISGEFNASHFDERKAIALYNCINVTIKYCKVFPFFNVLGFPAYGIYSEGGLGTMSFKNNELTVLGSGIFIEHLMPENTLYDIQDNDIYAQRGIVVDNYSQTGTIHLTVKENTVRHRLTKILPPPYPGGILLNRINGLYEVKDNTIIEIPVNKSDSYPFGGFIRNIGLSSCTGRGDVSNNTIDYPVSLNSTGIGISTSRNISFFGNTLTGALHNDEQGYGIDVNNSSNLFFCCNTIDSTDYGTRFSSANNDIKFFTTTFGVHDTALYFPPAASISKQFNTGNNWAGAIADLDAYYNGTSFQAKSNAPFQTNNSNINAFKIVPPGWFLLQGTDPSCSGQTYPCIESLPTDSLTELTDDDLLALTEPEADNEYVLRFEQQRLLYRKLKEHPEFIEWNEDVAKFYEDADTNIIGAFDAIDEAFRQCFPLSNGLTQSFNVIYDEIDSLSVLVNNIFTQYPSASSSEQAELEEDLQKLTDQIVTAQYESDTLFAQADTEMQENLTQLLEVNDALPATETWEINEREINVLFFKFFCGAIDSFTNQEKEDIIALSNACPQYEGAGVYKARLLRGTFIDTTFIGYYENHCVSGENKSVKTQDIDDTKNVLLISPNPAVDLISIPLDKDSENQILIRDLSGRILISKNISGDPDAKLNIAGIPSGVYFLTRYSTRLAPASAKLIIFR